MNRRTVFLSLFAVASVFLITGATYADDLSDRLKDNHNKRMQALNESVHDCLNKLHNNSGKDIEWMPGRKIDAKPRQHDEKCQQLFDAYHAERNWKVDAQ